MGKITKKMVDGIKPEAKDVFLWDTALAGFGVRVKPSGHKGFLVQYRHEGRTRRFTLGAFGELTVDEARRMAKKILADVASGADPSQERKDGRQALTVKDLAIRYLREHAEARKKQSSIDRDRQLIARFVLPLLGPMKIRAVTRPDVVQLHHKIGQDTPVQANRLLACLSKMFSLAISWGLRPDALGNPCQYVQRFKESVRERFLTMDELARLGQALADAELDGREMPGAVTAIRLLLLTGLRREEVLTLQWADVDLEHGVLHLRDSKTGGRSVPISAVALEVLASTPRQAGIPYVCQGKVFGRPFVGLPRVWYRICQNAGLEGVRIHDLRHSFASVGASGGMGLPILGKLLGHTQAATTARYSHLYQDPLKQAADQIGGRIAEALAAAPGEKVVDLAGRRKGGGNE